MLVALGERLTNAEIAGRLFISVRTVESHVSALLRKFNVHSRRELAEVGRRSYARGTHSRRPLPARLTACLGRDDDIAAATALIRECRIVTLTGPGGVGKTRLALEVASALEPALDGDVSFVDLTAAIDEATAVTAFAAALDTTGDAGSATREGLLQLLRTDHEMLLVVDNCEHILDAAAQLVTDAVGAAPGVQVLATSRELLGIPGERVLSVNPLDAASAAQLFWDRAVSVDRSVLVDEPAAADAVRSICRRLDGLPLAIELAAAQASLLTPHQIDARLGDRFSLLRSTVRGRAARHAALETALAWSYDLLDPRERVLLDRLSVFRGQFGLDAAETVATGPPVERAAVVDLVGRLVRKSLVVAETVGDERRFRLLETIREYGWGRLEAAGELGVWRHRHFGWVLELLQRADAGVQSGEQARWFAILDEDLPNIEWALEWSLHTPDQAGEAFAAVDNLHTYWLAGGVRRREGLRWLHATSEAATTIGEPVRTRALVDAVLLVTLDDLRAAEALADQARIVAGEDSLAKAYAALARTIVNVHGASGDLDPGLYGAIEKLDVDDPLHWWARSMHGFHLIRRGHFTDAASVLRRSGDGFRRLGDEHLADGGLAYIADLVWVSGDHDTARADTAQALEVARRFNCASCESLAVGNLVLMAEVDADGDPLAAARHALRLAWGIGETWNVLASLDLVAGALADQESYHDAALVGSAAVALREGSGFSPLLPLRAAEAGRGLGVARARLTPTDAGRIEQEGRRLSFDSAVAVALA